MVEHRGVEPLTSTLRTLRATNCANAPYSVDLLIIAQHGRFCKGDFSEKCVEKCVKEERMCAKDRRFEVKKESCRGKILTVFFTSGRTRAW